MSEKIIEKIVPSIILVLLFAFVFQGNTKLKHAIKKIEASEKELQDAKLNLEQAQVHLREIGLSLEEFKVDVDSITSIANKNHALVEEYSKKWNTRDWAREQKHREALDFIRKIKNGEIDTN